MTVEGLNLERKTVVVGIRLDARSKELLDWALVKVAEPCDSVVAICVCLKADCISKEKAWLDGYLGDYEGLCSEKQVALSADVLKGISLRRVIVREAKNHNASSVVVGINKHSALGGSAAIAKYCAKRLPPTTEVLAVYNGKVIYSSSRVVMEGPVLDPKPSFCVNRKLTLKESYSEFEESDISESSGFNFDGRDLISRDDVLSPAMRRYKGSSLSLISLPEENFSKHKPGWPLLKTTSSVTQLGMEARNMSVVKWVMALPQRSLSDISGLNSPASCRTGDSVDKRSELSITEAPVSEHELPKDLEFILTKHSVTCKVFSYDFLNTCTAGFATGNLIGNGGCNTVYKGILVPEAKPVAVKILQSSKETWTDFIREIDIITTLNHRGIAPLIGICVEDNHLISVYDFLSKGSLEENLHVDRKGSSVLSWDSRFQIAVGVAEALNYLHNECPRPVIHRDVKSSNILLTDGLGPQLCDFGLAMWGSTTASFLMDNDVVGTFGYLAPEYFMYGKVSDKIDVYAFGVVLLELLSGRKSIGLEITKGLQQSLVMWAKPRLASRDFESILDLKLDGNYDKDQMQRMAQAAALCLTQAARLRPKMCQILSILNGDKSADESRKNCGVSDDDLENQECNGDDEVYPDSSAESHLSLALLDVHDNSASFSSLDQSSPLSVEVYLKKRYSNSSNL